MCPPSERSPTSIPYILEEIYPILHYRPMLNNFDQRCNVFSNTNLSLSSTITPSCLLQKLLGNASNKILAVSSHRDSTPPHIMFNDMQINTYSALPVVMWPTRHHPRSKEDLRQISEVHPFLISWACVATFLSTRRSSTSSQQATSYSHARRDIPRIM